MAVTRRSLRLLRQLRATVGQIADKAAARIEQAWSGAANNLSSDWKSAADAAADLTQRSGRQPAPWQLARIPEVGDVLRRGESALTRLTADARTTVTAAAGDATEATVAGEPQILEAQIPDVASVLSQFRRGVERAQAYRQGSTDQNRIQASLDAIPASTLRGMQRALLRGGEPATVAFNLGQAFSAGGIRAANTARTEALDAYRAAAADTGRYHEQIAAGWYWVCACDRRSCPSCWALHGTLWPLTQAGPLDHPQGRCARLLKLHPWAHLGVRGREPDDQIPDARAAFARLSRADQLAVMGPARLHLLDAGLVTFTDLPTLRPGRGWRDAYVPTSVADLQNIARRRAS